MNLFGILFVALIEGLFHLVRHIYFLFFARTKIRKLLKHHSAYYRKLAADKKLFERKVWDFIRYNEFIPREEQRVTFTLKTIIASHAVQLALYLPEEAYDYYDKIILYKDYYLSRVTHKYHKGEVNPSLKVIVFSIRAIYESLEHKTDGVNVMLHEFAHALWLEHKLMGHEYKIFNLQVFASLESLIDHELEQSQLAADHLFRNYAFANKSEFFAVATENFFERPDAFQQELPRLYEMLTHLFRQDPLQIKQINLVATRKNNSKLAVKNS